LVELLVVIAIIGILIGMLLPAVQQVRAAARRIKCGNNIKQLSLGLHNYESAHQKFPAGSFGNGYWGRDSYSWYNFVLPFIEQNNAYNELDFKKRFNGPESILPSGVGSHARTELIESMLCPSDPTTKIQEQGIANWQNSLHNYVACYGDANFNSGTPWNVVDGYVGTAGMFVPEKNSNFGQCTDGSSNTLFISEIITPEQENIWGSLGRTQVSMGAGFTGYLTPNANANDRLNRAHLILASGLGPKCIQPHPEWDWGANVVAARSFHPGGVNAGLTDGSVQFVADTVSVDTWRALSARSDGKVIGEY